MRYLWVIMLIVSCSKTDNENSNDTSKVISEIITLDKCSDSTTIKTASFDVNEVLQTWKLNHIINLTTCELLPKDEKYPEKDESYLTFAFNNKLYAKTSNELTGNYEADNGKVSISNFGGTKMGELKLQSKFRDEFSQSTHFFIAEDELNILANGFKLVFEKYN